MKIGDLHDILPESGFPNALNLQYVENSNMTSYIINMILLQEFLTSSNLICFISVLALHCYRLWFRTYESIAYKRFDRKSRNLKIILSIFYQYLGTRTTLKIVMVNQIDIFYIRKYRHIEGGYQDALYSKNNGGKFSNIYKT